MNITQIPFGPAAGMIKTYEQALQLVGAACTRVTIGSITVLPRPGNSGAVYHFDPDTRTSHNSLGLPNPGMDDAKTWLLELKHRLNDCGQELCVSVAGFSPEEYAILTGTLLPLVDRIELNLGCPNVWSKDGQKPIVSYHSELLIETLSKIRAQTGNGQPISAKISPVENNITLTSIFAQITADEVIDEIVAVNTLPNQDFVYTDGRHALSFCAGPDLPIQHTGGMAGTSLKKHSLRVLRFLRQRELYKTFTRFPIISVGGIFTAQDAKDYLDAGANGFEVGTAYYEYGPRILEEIASGLMNM